jgi:hypothetical protein
MLPLPPLLLPLRPMLLLRLHGLDDVRRQLPAARGETSSGDASAASIVATTPPPCLRECNSFLCVFLGQV